MRSNWLGLRMSGLSLKKVRECSWKRSGGGYAPEFPVTEVEPGLSPPNQSDGVSRTSVALKCRGLGETTTPESEGARCFEINVVGSRREDLGFLSMTASSPRTSSPTTPTSRQQKIRQDGPSSRSLLPLLQEQGENAHSEDLRGISRWSRRPCEPTTAMAGGKASFRRPCWRAEDTPSPRCRCFTVAGRFS